MRGWYLKSSRFATTPSEPLSVVAANNAPPSPTPDSGVHQWGPLYDSRQPSFGVFTRLRSSCGRSLLIARSMSHPAPSTT